MPIITAGVPLITTVEGLRERLDQPADTETRLYWEMQLDRGDATLIPLGSSGAAEAGSWEHSPQFTHRLVSETGGVFHVRIEEGSHEWPSLSIPAALAGLFAMVEELERLRRQMQTLLVANGELEQAKGYLEARVQHLEELLAGRPPYSIGGQSPVNPSE